MGDDGFARVQSRSVLVDTTVLIADAIDGGATCMLFCRPRRLGKTLNMTMLKSLFEIPAGRFAGETMTGLFEGTEMWDAARVGTAPIRARFMLCTLASTR